LRRSSLPGVKKGIEHKAHPKMTIEKIKLYAPQSEKLINQIMQRYDSSLFQYF
jgi:hypothetical protein